MRKVMIIDDNKTNLIMAKKALEDMYEIVPVSSGEMALDFLCSMPDPPDLVLLDVDMPDVNGFYVISQMKNNEKLINIPVIFLTAQEDAATEVEGYALGAVDYIKKPFTATLLRKRVVVHMSFIEEKDRLMKTKEALTEALNGRIHDIVELEYAIVEMTNLLMASRSFLISEHCNRVENYMSIFIDSLIASGRFNIEESDAQILKFASRMHDIGKLCLPDRCLADMVDMSLSEKEFARAHPVLGAEAIKKVINAISENRFLTYAHNMARFHHERWDGKGFPDGLLTDNIPFEARILSIVNSYDDFRTSPEGALSHAEAINRIRFWSGTHFDPDLVEAFLSIESRIATAAIQQ